MRKILWKCLKKPKKIWCSFSNFEGHQNFFSGSFKDSFLNRTSKFLSFFFQFSYTTSISARTAYNSLIIGGTIKMKENICVRNFTLNNFYNRYFCPKVDIKWNIRGCHHDTLLHIWYCNSCSNNRFWLIFLLIDRSRSQAALMQVSSTLLNSDLRTRVKCENTFCLSWWQITSHNDTPLLPRWHTFKKHWKQWGHHYTTNKKFTHKKILYIWQKYNFCSSISISIHYDHLQKIIPYFSHI